MYLPTFSPTTSVLMLVTFKLLFKFALFYLKCTISLHLKLNSVTKKCPGVSYYVKDFLFLALVFQSGSSVLFFFPQEKYFPAYF